MCILRALYWCCECVAKRVFSCSDLPSQAVPCRSRCGRPVNQLCMVEAVEGEFCLPEVSEAPEATRCVLLCMLEAVEGRLCLLEVLYVLDVLGGMRCVLLCVREVVEGGLCLLEALEGMHHALLCMLEAVEGRICLLEGMCCVLLCMLEVWKCQRR